MSPTFNVADLSPYHGDGSNEDLRTSLFQIGKNDTSFSSCSPSNNKNPKSTKNEELNNVVSWAPSHDISYETSQDITWETSYIKDISVHVHGLNKERGDQVKKSSIVGASLTSQSFHLSSIFSLFL